MKVKVLPGQAICEGPSLIGEGSIVDLSEEEAKRMIDSGVCEAIKAKPKPKPKPKKKAVSND